MMDPRHYKIEKTPGKRSTVASAKSVEIKSGGRKTTARKCRKEIRETQWKYWVEKLQSVNQTRVHHVDKTTNKQQDKRAMPDIECITELQGKCAVLRELFFPAYVTTSSSIPPSYLPTPTQDMRNTFTVMSPETIIKRLLTSRNDSAIRPDNISYQMIEVTATGNKHTITYLFTNLLRHRAFHPEWKIAKCLPIRKSGKTDLDHQKGSARSRFSHGLKSASK